MASGASNSGNSRRSATPQEGALTGWEVRTILSRALLVSSAETLSPVVPDSRAPFVESGLR